MKRAERMPAKKRELRGYTRAEVAEHNTRNDAWIIVENKVYDVTRFIKMHPGGAKILSDVAGTDATKAFHNFHRWDVMKRTGVKYEIGSIVAWDQPKQKKKKAPKRTADSFGDMVPYGDPSWYQDWKSPYYNDSHRRFRTAIREFCDREFLNAGQWDEMKRLPRDLCKKFAKAGFYQGVTGPGPHLKKFSPPGFKMGGGVDPDEFDRFHELIIVDEVCRKGNGGLAWGLMGGFMIGLPPLLKARKKPANYEQIVRDCLAGEKIICLAITGPEAGSDVANLSITAKKTPCGKYYIVNGHKKWITNGIFADYFTVAVRTGPPGSGMAGMSLLLIERGPGVKTKQMKCQGVWASGTTYIMFENAKVPVENLIGYENQGFIPIMENFNHERWGICTMTGRFARVCLEEAIKYAHKRKTFGVRLIDHPVIRNKIGNMAKKVEATWSWVEALTYQMNELPYKDAQKRLGGPLALAKAQCTQTFEYCAREAVQIFGGAGYTRNGQGTVVERMYREVRAMSIPAGSEEIMLDLGVRQAMKFYPHGTVGARL